MIQFREARSEDDEQLTRLVGKPMPGDLSLSMSREPSLLAACERHGPRRRVLTAVEGENIMAVCTYFPWNYWVADEVRRVWTVADFRAERRAAGLSVTGLGWQALRERLDGEPALISLLDDNPVSYRLFSKARPGWPRLQRVARLTTSIIPLAFVPVSKTFVFRPRAEQIARVLKPKEAHLTPCLSVADLGRVTPGPESFLAYHDGCRTTACGALWDASDHRQIRIAGYSGNYARLRQIFRRLGLDILPNPGSQVPVQFAAFLRGRCRRARERVFSGLVELARARGAQFLVLGQDAEEAPPFPKYWPRFIMSSSLYQLKWADEFELGFARSGYEVAWL